MPFESWTDSLASFSLVGLGVLLTVAAVVLTFIR
jgi:hypothetical protein